MTLNKQHADNINQLTKDYLQDEEAFELAGKLATYVKENCDDLYINDKVNLIGQTIPLLFNQPSVDSEQMLDGNPLPEVVKAINYVVSDEVFDIFVAETKIELTEENKSDIYNFFIAKGNWQSDEYRKQGLATLIEALLKSYNTL